jgi:hypothetical protein|eukprot:COSAG03_NODE_1150_length_4703_cov_101.178106_6_plen_120_part_00
MVNSSCEFDANCDIFDPHTDAGCNTSAVLGNITRALAAHGNGLGFFERPCNEIVTPDYHSASMSCPEGARTPPDEVVFKKGAWHAPYLIIRDGPSGDAPALIPVLCCRHVRGLRPDDAK